jgi:uncharacterized membrane protein
VGEQVNMLIEILAEILKITVLAGVGIAGILAILIWKKGLATKVTYLRFVVLYFLESYTFAVCFGNNSYNAHRFRQILLWLALPFCTLPGFDNCC